jgi:hypothetical protein
VTTVLEEAGIPYAVIGGNAVAAWVASVDEEAVRATKGVDILLRRADLEAAARAVTSAGLILQHAFSTYMFVDAQKPSARSAVDIILANEAFKIGHPRPAPDVDNVQRAASGFRILDLYSLVVMKLDAFRRVDQVHLEDLLRLGLIDADLAKRLPEDLLLRLREVRDTMEWTTSPPEF